MPGPSEDTGLLRTQVDDAVRALIRTQQVVSISGNVFTGGLEEPVFDIHIDKIMNLDYRPGSPGAGALRSNVDAYVSISSPNGFRWTTLSRYNTDQVRGVAH